MEKTEKPAHSRPLAIRTINQLDNHTFQIEWNDGTIGSYRLNELQKKCPCANCVDESTGKRIHPPSNVKSDVKAINIRNIGRYALKIQFTSGCSTGIYSFEMLYNSP